MNLVSYATASVSNAMSILFSSNFSRFQRTKVRKPKAAIRAVNNNPAIVSSCVQPNVHWSGAIVFPKQDYIRITLLHLLPPSRCALRLPSRLCPVDSEHLVAVFRGVGRHIHLLAERFEFLAHLRHPRLSCH